MKNSRRILAHLHPEIVLYHIRQGLTRGKFAKNAKSSAVPNAPAGASSFCNNKNQETWECAAKGSRGATAKPPCRARRRDSLCNKWNQATKEKKDAAHPLTSSTQGCLYLPHRMPNHGFPFLRRCFPRVGKVNLVMQPLRREVIFIPVLAQKRIHLRHRRGFVVVCADVHHLHTKSFANRAQFSAGAVKLLLRRRRFHRPAEILRRHEIRYANHGQPAEIRLAPVVYA